MNVEQFHAELLRRLKLDEISYDFREFAELHYKYVSREINAMTGGAFFRSIEKLRDDYVFPSGEEINER